MSLKNPSDRWGGVSQLLHWATVVLIVAITYVLSLYPPPHLFDLGVWCFTGFSGLFPLVFASLYWRRVTRAGAFASLITTAVV